MTTNISRIESVDSVSDTMPYDHEMLFDKIKNELSKFGLTQNQSKVFLYLEKYGSSTATQVSKALKVPRTETYHLLTNLQNKGIHFFNPPQLMKLVEVIPGQKTSKELVDTTINFVRSVSKEPVLCKKDVPGFIVNRLFIPLVHEAAYAMDRTGATKEEIDSAVKFTLHFPMGIFELADFTGMDVIHKATIEMHSRDNKVINPHPLIEKMYNEKKLGQKSGEGFYKYSQEQYERINLSEELAKKFNPIQLLGNILNNAAWLVTNQASDIPEIEKALSLGMGLKKPLFDTAKEFGMSNIVHELQNLAKQNKFYEPDPYLLSTS